MGLNFFIIFASNVAVREASDQVHERARVDLVNFGPPDPNQTFDKFMIVYLISEIQRSETHFTIYESWSDTWLLVDALMKIERLNSREKVGLHRGIVAHFLYARWHHLSCPISQKEIDGLDLITKYFYKFMFSLFYVILTLDSTLS